MWKQDCVCSRSKPYGTHFQYHLPWSIFFLVLFYFALRSIVKCERWLSVLLILLELLTSAQFYFNNILQYIVKQTPYCLLYSISNYGCTLHNTVWYRVNSFSQYWFHCMSLNIFPKKIHGILKIIIHRLSAPHTPVSC